jgi:hypothetical protein
LARLSLADIVSYQKYCRIYRSTHQVGAMAIHRLVSVCTVLALCAAAQASYAQQAPLPPATPPATPAADSVPVTLIGRVVDSIGGGLVGAEITLLKSDRVRAITGDSGQFRIAGLAAGTTVFNVRRIGFEAASFTAVLHSGKTQRATFRLTPSAQSLPTVAISDTAVQTHWLDAFDRRKSGARGTFITRAQMDKMDARSGADVLRTVPGVRVEAGRGGMGNRVIMNRGSGVRQCVPTTYVHGMQYSGTIDDFAADEIEALEVYVGISEIPPELDKIGKGICGVIVIWTRDPRKAP